MTFTGAKWAPLALFAVTFHLSGQSGLEILREKCAACHGPSQQMGGYDLRTREAALKAIVPGAAEASPLVRRLTGQDKPAMPLGGRLKDAEIAAIRRWIDDGAHWTDAAAPAAPVTNRRVISDEDRNWWAFRKPVRHAPPGSAASPVDAFIAARRTAPSAPRADKFTLVRRAYLDLTGLPPSPAETDAFVQDTSPGAFAKLVDRLLASPHYGERWGRHWLDAARYADSRGYEQDFTYPNAWRYRDYVIRAFNQDKPYDRFIREQLAGDELDNPDYDALIATGFHRVGATVGFREKDNPQYRYIYLDDMIGVTSRVFLGLTVNCARCHDHKFDPITQNDYYRLMAVFFPHIDYDHPLAPADEVAVYESRKKAIDTRIEPLKDRIREIEEPYRKAAFDKYLDGFPADIQAAVRAPEEQRTEGQKLLAAQVLTIQPPNFRSAITEQDRAEIARLTKEVKDLEAQLPAPLPVAMGIRDGDYRLAPLGPGDNRAPGKGVKTDTEGLNDAYAPAPGAAYKPPRTYFLEGGDYLSRGPEVQPGFPEVLGGLSAPHALPPKDGRVTTGRRRALAEWIASPDNPLTARVMANRIWQHHFGRGLVSTASNFGKLGTPPSHPELLDWLATEFVRSGWSVKRMHRLIMNSDTYQMASAFDSGPSLEADPDNLSLWRFPLRRLEAESIRDTVLAVSGNLNLKAGGPGFFPPAPESVLKSVFTGEWVKNQEGPDVWRRSVYQYYKRGMKHPFMEVFDQPDPNVTCEGRVVSTAPTQALTLLNNEFVLAQARAFAERVRAAAGAEQSSQVRAAFKIGLSRDPGAKELAENIAFLNRRMESQKEAADPALEALTDLCDVILNLNEFLYLQ